jgi:hypothetical protein
MTTTWNGLLEQLAQAEKAKKAAERTGEQGILLAEAKIANVTHKVSEMTTAHEKELADIRFRHDEQLLDAKMKGDLEVETSTSARLKAEARIEIAEVRRIKAEQEAKVLEGLIRQLCSELDQQQQQCEAKCVELRDKTDQKVERVLGLANQRVSDLSHFASDVQEAASTTIKMLDQHMEGISRCYGRAEERSQFQEMCALTKMQSDHKMSKKDYEDAKGKLINSWNSQWDKNTAIPSPGSTSLGGTLTPLTTPMTPASRGGLAGAGAMIVGSDTKSMDSMQSFARSHEDFLTSHLS